jgi:hypothetical protein
MSNDGINSGVSRRNLLLAVASAAPLVALASTRAEAKIPQKAVAYQDTPVDGKQCSTCNFFIEPNACKQVDGEIKPEGYCKLYNKKPAS